MRSESISFRNADGIELAGALDLPPGKPRAFALFAHCFSCSSQSHAAKRIAQALTLHGIATLRFDFTGLGISGGEFADSHFAANVDDLKQAARYLSDKWRAPTVLIGHSLGGTAVIAAAGDLPSIKAVVTIGAPFDPAHVLQHFGSSIDEIEQVGEADVTIAGRTFTVRKDFLDAAREQDQGRRLAELKCALLVMHSPVDEIVGIDNAREIFEAARHPKSFLSLDGADHLLTEKRDGEQAATLIASWAERYLGLADEVAIELEGSVQVRSTDGKFLQDVVAGEHRFVADEPVRLGGWNAGPTPYDLLLASLGTCTAMTIKMFAAREKIPLEDVSIGLRHDRVHGEDCEANQGKIERITRHVELTGSLSDDQRKQLIAIADRCPVHHTLTSDLRIETLDAVGYKKR
ncbi:OsmC family protein [Sphingomonas suaedae]|uniref:OsmC family protein n=1 Tax=Sphingomonas suaedae TaxID=2599297 RepID=A0A518RHL1_9SPHN|nr:bifunctional alpha/beta hydrolase/OsmC family protein [Sphingomonas suaedae]QDX26925.1 OsmC family protein [Sphingomonas suaedae]